MNPAVSSQRSPGPPSWWGGGSAPSKHSTPRYRLLAQWKILGMTVWKGGFLAGEEANKLCHSRCGMVIRLKRLCWGAHSALQDPLVGEEEYHVRPA